MCASEPSMIGEPSGEGRQSIPANLSESLEPKRAETSFCFSCSTLTQNRPVASIAFHEFDTLVGQNNTSGGSSDSAAKDWQGKPPTGGSPTPGVTAVGVQDRHVTAA